MAVTVDHITAGDSIRVIREFTDFHGRTIAAGQRGRVVSIDAPWTTQIATFVIEGPGGRWNFSVDLRAPHGPRHGHMRDYVSTGGQGDGTPDPPVKVVAPLAVAPPPAPLPGREWDERGYRQAIERVVALAEEHDFDAAATAFSDLMMLPGVYNEYLPVAAGCLEAAAARFATLQNKQAFEWLFERTIEAWHYWAAQATSGGEGTALMLNVTKAQHRREELSATWFKRRGYETG